MYNLKKYNKLVNITKKKQTHRYRKQTSSYQWEERRGEGQNRGRGRGLINYKDMLYNTGSIADIL